MRQAPTDSTVSTIAANRAAFGRHLRAENKAPATIDAYMKAVDQLHEYLERVAMPTAVGAIKREHVEAFLNDCEDRGLAPATRAQRYRSLQQFWKWLVDEGEVHESPMAKMRPPLVPVEPPPILQEDEQRRLLKAAAGDTFIDRRDTAVLRLFIDTGMRRAELAGLTLADLHQPERRDQQGIAVVMGKGRRPRQVPYGRKAAAAIDRYLRLRDRHPYHDLDALWLGKRGQLGATGVEQLVKRRAAMAGLEGVHPHLFRHTSASDQLSMGTSEGNLMQLMGWRSRQMLNRYGAAEAASRARAAYKSPGDRL